MGYRVIQILVGGIGYGVVQIQLLGYRLRLSVFPSGVLALAPLVPRIPQ